MTLSKAPGGLVIPLSVRLRCGARRVKLRGAAPSSICGAQPCRGERPLPIGYMIRSSGSPANGEHAMARHPVWLEAALNGPWGRDLQPGIPVTVAEIIAEGIACAEAGAAIVHIHAYDAATGRQKDDPELYAAIIAGIRDRV